MPPCPPGYAPEAVPKSNSDEKRGENNPELTNIDDVLSDTEDDLPDGTKYVAKPKNLCVSSEVMDQMILNASATPPTSKSLCALAVKSVSIDKLLKRDLPTACELLI